MATPSKQIGWGAEENLLSFISKQLGYLTNVAYNSGGGGSGGVGPQGPMGPQGLQGIPGIDGAVGPAGLEWRGPWVSGTSYVADDAVGYAGASWFCILATSNNQPPNLATSNWALLASQGAIGPTGSQGPTGAQGPAGSIIPIVASAPLTGGTISTTGTIGISQATTSTNGYLSSTDFTTFNNKQNALVFTPYNATNPSAFIPLTSISATSPIFYNNTSGVISSQAATSSVNGYLTSGDWATFNGKANVNSQTFTGTPSLPIGTTGVTQVAGTNNTTLATTEFVVAAANNRLVTETTLGHTLTNADSGGIIIFKTTANQTLTIPTGLADGFECTFVTLAGVTLTVSAGSNVLNNALGTLLAPQLSFTLKRMMAANTFIATGNL
jgi:hypothetical protein